MAKKKTQPTSFPTKGSPFANKPPGWTPPSTRQSKTPISDLPSVSKKHHKPPKNYGLVDPLTGTYGWTDNNGNIVSNHPAPNMANQQKLFEPPGMFGTHTNANGGAVVPRSGGKRTTPQQATAHLPRPNKNTRGTGGRPGGVTGGRSGGSAGGSGGSAGGGSVGGGASAPVGKTADQRVEEILQATLNAARMQSRADAAHVTRSGLDLDKSYQAINPAYQKLTDHALDQNRQGLKAQNAALDATAAAVPNITGQTAEGAAANTNMQVAADRNALQGQSAQEAAELNHSGQAYGALGSMNRMLDQSKTISDTRKAGDTYAQAKVNAPLTRLDIEGKLNDIQVKNLLAGNTVNATNANIEQGKGQLALARDQFDQQKAMQEWQKTLSAKEFALKKRQLRIANSQVQAANLKNRGNIINGILSGQPITMWSVGKGKNGRPVSIRQTIPGYGRPQSYEEAVSMLVNAGISKAEAQRAAAGARLKPADQLNDAFAGLQFPGIGN